MNQELKRFISGELCCDVTQSQKTLAMIEHNVTKLGQIRIRNRTHQNKLGG